MATLTQPYVASGVAPWRAVVRALRPHQWSKNLLLFLPLVCAHQIGNSFLWEQVGLAFLLFSLGASGQYLINDLLDREADRLHPIKRNRPVASGQLSPMAAVVLAAGLIGVSLAGAGALSLEFLLVVALYQVLTPMYSLWLKRQAILDVLLLACLFTLRVFAGGAVTGIVVSPWLLTFSLFLFLMLAILKRFAEIRSQGESIAVRGYQTEDESILIALGIAAGYLSVLVMAFYIQQPTTTAMYRHAGRLWLLCPILLYWISRLWLIAFRRRMPGDPLDFSLTDGVSYLVMVSSCAVVYASV